MAQVRTEEVFSTQVSASHPLDPLSAAELQAAVDLVRREHGLDQRVLFETVALHEPEKQAVRSFTTGSEFEREALVVVIDRSAGKNYEGIVSLTKGRMVSWREILRIDREGECVKQLGHGLTSRYQGPFKRTSLSRQR